MAIKFEWTPQISIGDKVWVPTILTVGGDSCTRLNPYDYAFVSIVALAAGVASIKYKDRPTVGLLDGYTAIKRIRNAAQAVEMQPPAPKRKLFGGDVDDCPRNALPKRSHCDIAEQYRNPQMFKVSLPSQDGQSSTHVWLQRPIKATDEIVIKLDQDNLSNMIEFIVERGVTRELLCQKRTYGASGRKGVWKLRGKFWEVGKGVVPMLLHGTSPSDDEDDDQVGRAASHDQDDVVGASDLPDVE